MDPFAQGMNMGPNVEAVRKQMMSREKQSRQQEQKPPIWGSASSARANSYQSRAALSNGGQMIMNRQGSSNQSRGQLHQSSGGLGDMFGIQASSMQIHNANEKMGLPPRMANIQKQMF